MALTQTDKATQFHALHEAPDAFVIANVWDGGSARMMAGLGFGALATSSGASAGLLGRRDGKVTRDEALAQARVKVAEFDGCRFCHGGMLLFSEPEHNRNRVAVKANEAATKVRN